MIGALLTSLLFSLLLTLGLEAGFFLLVGKRHKKDLLLLVLVNVLTNPAVVLSFWLVKLYTDWDARIALLPLELLAMWTEGYCYQKYGCSFRRPYAFAIAANLFSFWAGVFIQQLI